MPTITRLVTLIFNNMYPRHGITPSNQLSGFFMGRLSSPHEVVLDILILEMIA